MFHSYEFFVTHLSITSLAWLVTKRVGLHMFIHCDIHQIKESILMKWAPNTVNRDELANYLSHMYCPLLTSPTANNHWSRRLDQSPIPMKYAIAVQEQMKVSILVVSLF